MESQFSDHTTFSRFPKLMPNMIDIMFMQFVCNLNKVAKPLLLNKMFNARCCYDFIDFFIDIGKFILDRR